MRKFLVSLAVICGLLSANAASAQVGPLDARNNLADVANSPLSLLNLGGAALFGTGVDGTLACGSFISLVRDMQYSALTLNAGCSIATNGFRIFVSGLCDFSTATAGAIEDDGFPGNNASGTTPGAGTYTSPGAANSQSLPYPYQAGAAGGTPTTGTGGAGVNGVAVNALGGSGSQSGGAGGAGTPGAGGAAGPHDAAVLFGSVVNAQGYFGPWFTSGGVPLRPGNSGSGGGAGGGDGTNLGGGGGGGAYGGQFVVVACRTLFTGTNTHVGIFQAVGTPGGNGGTPTVGNVGGGGAGSASGGGFVSIVAGTRTGSAMSAAIDVSGGKGGNGGNGVGTGLGGQGTSGGFGGRWQVTIIYPPAQTSNFTSAAGAAPTAPSGITGGVGGAGAITQGGI